MMKGMISFVACVSAIRIAEQNSDEAEVTEVSGFKLKAGQRTIPTPTELQEWQNKVWEAEEARVAEIEMQNEKTFAQLTTDQQKQVDIMNVKLGAQEDHHDRWGAGEDYNFEAADKKNCKLMPQYANIKGKNVINYPAVRKSTQAPVNKDEFFRGGKSLWAYEKEAIVKAANKDLGLGEQVFAAKSGAFLAGKAPTKRFYRNGANYSNEPLDLVEAMPVRNGNMAAALEKIKDARENIASI
jgi:hypothetical protein